MTQSTTCEDGLATRYAPGFNDGDEMFAGDRTLRDHWKTFVKLLDEIGPEQLQDRREEAQRLIRENGISHNVYDDPQGLARPWSLDIMPLLLPARQWEDTGLALIQRARLLDALLADLYGPATCVTQGILPPELVYASPRFLRACHGIVPARGRWLNLYAADLARCNEGSFCVISDRTQAPSGAGYTLENRIVMTRVLGSIYGPCNIQRLAPFFIAMRQMLTSLAPSNREEPRIVLLTPGPYNETYFEHAYLARYLGYTLVQGKDLTIRDLRVYLKTLGGLQRVDVILRRVDDEFCDPLELYPNSYLGVPGLLQAVREGNVAVANALGSGAVGGPGFMPYLPALCRHFLSEELKMASVATWWCGEPGSLKYVLDKLHELVIKPALPAARATTVFGHELSTSQRQELAQQIMARPANYVAQAYLSPSQTPIVLTGQVQSRRFVLRSYLTATADGYAVMSGGLTRVSGENDSPLVSLQKGAASKDTWILSDGPVSQVTLLPSAATPLALSRGGSDLPSRVADDLFWLGRYVQRAESTTRLARCIFNRLSDLNVAEAPRAKLMLIERLLSKPWQGMQQPSASALAAEIFSAKDPAAMRASARHFHSLARVLRDRISTDAWRIIQSIHRELTEFDAHIGADQGQRVIELLNDLITAYLSFAGMTAESMTRGQSWRFLDMGLRVERATASARLLRAMLTEVNPDENFVLDALLEVADSAMTYRRRYLNRLEVPAVVDLLLADETNPRAIAFQVRAIDEHLAALPHDPSHPQRNADMQLVIRLRSLLRLEDLSQACKITQGRRPRLDRLCGDTIDMFSHISERVGQLYFSHAMSTPHQLVQRELET